MSKKARRTNGARSSSGGEPGPVADHGPARPQAWCVYVLRCADGTLYTGATNDLTKRIARHASGKGAAYTRARLPVSLAWSEPAADRGSALRREAAIKRLRRAAKLDLLGDP